MDNSNTRITITASAVSRVWSKVTKSDDCWQWHGKMNRNGYGQVRLPDRHIQAHRLAYLLEVGPIAHGLVLDHLCRNRACVRPDHLEAVTQKENVNRGLAGALNPYRFVCREGHAIEGENAMPTKRGNPRCRECNRVYMRQYMKDLSRRRREAKIPTA
jgi:hypothetical protein